MKKKLGLATLAAVVIFAVVLGLAAVPLGAADSEVEFGPTPYPYYPWPTPPPIIGTPEPPPPVPEGPHIVNLPYVRK